jgi:hypothetical protein
MYVKFDESRWPEIKKAEEDTQEGNRIYDQLKVEFMERFFNVKSTSFEKASYLQAFETVDPQEKMLNTPMNS